MKNKSSKKAEAKFEVRINAQFTKEEAKNIVELLKANGIKARVFEDFDDLPF